jgi:phosphatidylserine decarboxylase
MSPYARIECSLLVLVGGAVTILTGLHAGLWALLPALLALALLAFYRDPPRRIPSDRACVLAPADGKIVAVTRQAAGPDGTPVVRVMVFLSVFNVHLNRSPCAGQVLQVDYRPGLFLNALRTEADERNESNRLTLRPDTLPGPIHVRQIAGVLARRIVCAAKPGQPLAAGERYGMIKLGSRTEILLPEDPRWELCVTVGDRVCAGTSVLAHFRAGPDRAAANA